MFYYQISMTNCNIILKEAQKVKKMISQHAYIALEIIASLQYCISWNFWDGSSLPSVYND